MNTKRVIVKNDSNTVRNECSVAAISERLFERTLTFTEVVELSEKCGLWDIEGYTKKAVSRPLIFAVPTTQVVASISRVVE
jgi:hypothetical protein